MKSKEEIENMIKLLDYTIDQNLHDVTKRDLIYNCLRQKKTLEWVLVDTKIMHGEY